jgi:hypothetical protein
VRLSVADLYQVRKHHVRLRHLVKQQSAWRESPKIERETDRQKKEVVEGCCQCVAWSPHRGSAAAAERQSYKLPPSMCVRVAHPSPNDHFEHCPAFRPGLFPLGAASPTFVFVIIFVGKGNFPTNHPYSHKMNGQWNEGIARSTEWN